MVIAVSKMDSSESQHTARVRQFGELLSECHHDLFSFIYSLVQHHADAEDVYQQVTILLWKKFDSFTIGTNFKAWATKFAHNVARDFIRSRRRNAIAFSDEVLEAIAAAYAANRCWSSRDTSEALSQCLQKLNEKDRGLVERCYSKNQGVQDIALAEKRTVGAIYQAICRVRKKLYACVQRTLSQESYS